MPRQAATELIDAYHDGALALGEPFGVWGALALDRLDPDDVDRALERGCVGISLPAGALGNIDALTRLSPVLGRIEARGVPLFVHPGPGGHLRTREATLGDPLWWPALTRYVAEVHSAWFVFVTAARRQYPKLRVVFAMLAGLAALHTERLLARGGPEIDIEDPLIFYDTSSNGPQAISLMERLVGRDQLLYGSDRPVVDPDCHGIRQGPDVGALGEQRRATPQARAGVSRLGRQEARADIRRAQGQARGRAREGSPMSGRLSDVHRPRGRDLSGPELERFVSELANSPELWIDLVKHDRTQRHYEEIYSDEHVTAWLICWMEDHDTGFHDHDVSCGAVSVVSGCVREERLTPSGLAATSSCGQAKAFTSARRTSTACVTPAETRR